MLGHVLFGLKSLKLHAPRRRALLATGLVPSFNRLGPTQLAVRICVQMQRRPLLYFMDTAPLLPLVVGRIDPTTDMVSAVMLGLVLGMQVLYTGEALQDMQSAIGALNQIQCIEATLRLEADAAIDPQNVFWPECISLVDVGYTHAGSDGFQLGPISFELKRGELLFVTGVNGSGKTTLIRLMTGLYRPQSGHILSDGELVEAGELAQLFVAVFNDFHLIRGIGDLSVRAREQFESTLRRLDLDRVTRLEDGRITAVNLSSGQRRRLALAVALTEERPFYLFDEWAADQDPAFRNWFYATLLPELRAAGHGVVVVTHDDRYFDRCDRHIKLEEGRMATAPVNV
jgi:putative ATP-binding cassette transporter